MKLIDCFMYFDEDLVLDIRLNTLKDNVDRFVIVEATKNHAGEDKNLKFKRIGSRNDLQMAIRRNFNF